MGIKTGLLVLLLVSGIAKASAQNLSPPLVEIPSASLAPPEVALPSLPAASTNLLAPNSGNEVPPDSLGANLQSTPSNPYLYATTEQRPAAAIDTIVRGEPAIGHSVQGSLSSRSLYSSAQAIRWSPSSATASMKAVPVVGKQPAPNSVWGLPPSPGAGSAAIVANEPLAPGLATAGRKRSVAAAKRVVLNPRRRASSRAQVDGRDLPIEFSPSTSGTQASFAQTPFASLDTAGSSYLQPDLTSVSRSRHTARPKPDDNVLPTRELARLQAILHPPSYQSRSGRKASHARVTMKSLIQQESQGDAYDSSTLPTIFFMPQ